MSVTVVAVFRAKPGKGEELASILRGFQPKLGSFAGFRSITLARDEADPDRVVEIERWDAAASHRAMVEAVGAAGGWDALDALTEGEPEVSYLAELASSQPEPAEAGPRGRVTGIGGVFFKGRDHEALRAWYREHLSIEPSFDGGTVFTWRHPDAPERTGATVWSIFTADTKYFDPGDKPFMINYRVDDLAAIRTKLRDAGVIVDDKVEDSDFGRFGWAIDPEGNRFELWEPPEE